MALSLKPQHLKRYGDIARLLWRYGRSDAFRHLSTLGDLLQEEDEARPNRGAGPEDLASDLEAMGPTFVKLGQILSSRPDLMPESYLKALARLQDHVKPFSFAEVEEIVQSELGVRLSKGFQSFESEPLAAASLGQVHRAQLRDGTEVVVKIQRPGIRRQIAEDLEVLEEIVALLSKHTQFAQRYQFAKILEEFRRTLLHELDYHREAANLRTISSNLREFPHVRIPRPIPDYSSRAVLTMEFVAGRKITSLTPLARIEIDGSALADELFQAYLKQVLVDGVFHADPHPGNVYITEEKEIALLDLGMVGHVTPGRQEQLIRLLLALSEGRAEEAATLAIQLSETTVEFDESDFRRQIGMLIAEQKDNILAEIEVGTTLLEITRTAGENGLFVPTELTLLGKALLQLDQIGRILDPGYNPNAAIRRHVTSILNQQFTKGFTPGRFFSTLLEVKEFVTALPPRLNKILDRTADAQFQITVRPSEMFMKTVQKVANRITAGLVLAALIIGAAMLMQVPTKFELFGYPGLAMLCFLAAAAGGVALLFNIFFIDHKDRKNRNSPRPK